MLDQNKHAPILPEDLFATGSTDTTIEGLDMDAPDWVEQAAEKVEAIEGDTYVKLNRGVLTVDQLNYFMASIPLELTYTDDNNQFVYYNYTNPAEKMMAPKRPEQVGEPIGKGHSPQSLQRVAHVVNQLRTGKTDVVRIPVPLGDPNKFLVHEYRPIKDEAGNYVGVNDFTFDLKPLIDWYLEVTGQELTGGVDAISGASKKQTEKKEERRADAVTSASKKPHR